MIPKSGHRFSEKDHAPPKIQRMIRTRGYRFSGNIMPQQRPNPAPRLRTDRSETMIFKHFSRAGLLAFAGALVLAILLCLPTFHAAFAETAAAAPPACDAK